MHTLQINVLIQWRKEKNQQNAQINFGLINLLLFNHSNMLSIPQQSHRDVNTYKQQHSNRLPQWLVTLKDFELPDDGFD